MSSVTTLACFGLTESGDPIAASGIASLISSFSFGSSTSPGADALGIYADIVIGSMSYDVIESSKKFLGTP
jgi:hypothetical protein